MNICTIVSLWVCVSACVCACMEVSRCVHRCVHRCVTCMWVFTPSESLESIKRQPRPGNTHLWCWEFYNKCPLLVQQPHLTALFIHTRVTRQLLCSEWDKDWTLDLIGKTLICFSPRVSTGCSTDSQTVPETLLRDFVPYWDESIAQICWLHIHDGNSCSPKCADKWSLTPPPTWIRWYKAGWSHYFMLSQILTPQPCHIQSQLNYLSSIWMLQTRQHFCTLLWLTFSEPVWSVTSGGSTGMVFCCCCTSAASFVLLCTPWL